jgi:hypothetical protein
LYCLEVVFVRRAGSEIRIVLVKLIGTAPEKRVERDVEKVVVGRMEIGGAGY